MLSFNRHMAVCRCWLRSVSAGIMQQMNAYKRLPQFPSQHWARRLLSDRRSTQATDQYLLSLISQKLNKCNIYSPSCQFRHVLLSINPSCGSFIKHAYAQIWSCAEIHTSAHICTNWLWRGNVSRMSNHFLFKYCCFCSLQGFGRWLVIICFIC